MGNAQHQQHQPKLDADNHSAHGETEASAGVGDVEDIIPSLIYYSMLDRAE